METAVTWGALASILGWGALATIVLLIVGIFIIAVIGGFNDWSH